MKIKERNQFPNSGSLEGLLKFGRAKQDLIEDLKACAQPSWCKGSPAHTSRADLCNRLTADKEFLQRTIYECV